MSSSTADKPRPLDPMVGSLLADRYRIERVIGRGGMGLVYLADDVAHERRAVIKLLAPQWLGDPTAVSRFEREGERLRQLVHPNIVQMYECGRHGEVAFIAMEYLDGEPLRRFLKRRGRLTLAEFVPIAAQILAAVGFAHTFGMMLRDIKPPNIMLCERGGKANFVKLLDFGLAKLVDGDQEEVTKSHVIGTAGYLAPEQIKGEPCDLRVDVYAIGVLFYLLLAGESPIEGENDGALLYNHVHVAPKPLETVLPAGHNVPDALVALVHQCLEKDPERRLSDANEIAEALFECVPPKLFALPDADDESRRAAREYRDARDRGVDEDGARAQSSSEWTKPVVKPDLGEPAEASAVALEVVPDADAPTKAAKAPTSPTARATPLPPAQARSEAPKRRPTSTIPPTGRAPTSPRLPPPTGRHVRPAAPIDDADAGVPVPIIRTASRALAIPPPRRLPRPSPRPIALDDIPELPGPARPAEEKLDTGPAALQETGPIASEAGVYDREPRRGWRLPIPRHVLALVGACLVTIGALAAWIIFVPPDVDMPVPETASATVQPTTTGREATDRAASPSPASATPSPAIETTAASEPEPPASDRGAVEVRAIAGARIEVDGVDMGPAPLVAPLAVGQHRIRITAPGYSAWEETIDVVEGDNPALEAKMRRKRGSKALPSVHELGEATTSTTDEPAPPSDPPPPASEPAPSDSPFSEPTTPSTTPAVVEAPKPPPPPPPAPNPRRNADPFLPVKKAPATDPGLLPTG